MEACISTFQARPARPLQFQAYYGPPPSRPRPIRVDRPNDDDGFANFDQLRERLVEEGHQLHDDTTPRGMPCLPSISTPLFAADADDDVAVLASPIVFTPATMSASPSAEMACDDTSAAAVLPHMITPSPPQELSAAETTPHPTVLHTTAERPTASSPSFVAHEASRVASAAADQNDLAGLNVSGMPQRSGEDDRVGRCFWSAPSYGTPTSTVPTSTSPLPISVVRRGHEREVSEADTAPTLEDAAATTSDGDETPRVPRRRRPRRSLRASARLCEVLQDPASLPPARHKRRVRGARHSREAESVDHARHTRQSSFDANIGVHCSWTADGASLVLSIARDALPHVMVAGDQTRPSSRPPRPSRSRTLDGHAFNQHGRARRAKGVERYSPEEDQLLVKLKEKTYPLLSWTEIAEHFPRRTRGSLQVRYCTALKKRQK